MPPIGIEPISSDYKTDILPFKLRSSQNFVKLTNKLMKYTKKWIFYKRLMISSKRSKNCLISSFIIKSFHLIKLYLNFKNINKSINNTSGFNEIRIRDIKLYHSMEP